MRFLIDSHVLLWAAENPSKLSDRVRSALEDETNELLLSAGSLWEISIKVALGKLTLSLPLREWLIKAIADLNLELLPITVDHVERLRLMPFHHRDPFDRLLVAQALVESMPLVSSDAVLDVYGLSRLW